MKEFLQKKTTRLEIITFKLSNTESQVDNVDKLKASISLNILFEVK